MIITREYPDERLDRVCYVLEREAEDVESANHIDIVAIDEDHLSWFYVAPGCELSALSRQLLTSACDLLGQRFWAVVQSHDPDPRDVIDRARLRVVESFVDAAESSGSINVYIVQVP